MDWKLSAAEAFIDSEKNELENGNQRDFDSIPWVTIVWAHSLGPPKWHKK